VTRCVTRTTADGTPYISCSSSSPSSSHEG
jgi:hypothetical protein